MKNVKLLITTGCSFTQYPNKDISWAYHLSQYLGCETLFLGQGAAGNGIISKHTIYQTTEALKKYKPEEILVGVMWSGPERHEVFFTEEPNIQYNEIYYGVDNMANPVKITEERNYYLINPHFRDELSKLYYRFFYDQVATYIKTIENILRTQWFLKLNKVPYFMTTYLTDTLPVAPHLIPIKNHPDVQSLYDMIDFNEFLKVSDKIDHDNCFSWCKFESGKDFRDLKNDHHPSTEQHLEFTNRVIIPHLLNKKMVY